VPKILLHGHFGTRLERATLQVDSHFAIGKCWLVVIQMVREPCDYGLWLQLRELAHKRGFHAH